MSYCRWSGEDYQCDVYVWADVNGGWRTEVAGRRWVYEVELPPPVELAPGCTDEQVRAWYQRHRTVTDLHGDETKGRWFDLPEPDGGRSFWHDTPGECADHLERLREAGFNVPQYAIDALRQEAAEVEGSGAVAGEGS